MRKLVVILGAFVILTGCNKPAQTPAYDPPVSQYDIAIENLSTTTEQLEDIRKEKDLFIKSLESFELQKNEYGYLMDANEVRRQMQYFTDWHKDIAIREKNLEVRHALNVLAANNQVIKRKMTDPNHITLSGFSSDKP